MTHDSKLIEFRRMLGDKSLIEQRYQDYLERNTEFIWTPYLLNHRLHLDCVLSKFPLDTSLVTDFAYLTKSTTKWWVVLIELETPHRRLFTKANKPSSDLTAAITQVNEWRIFINRNSAEVVRRLDPIRRPLPHNKVSFKYVLVIGRSTELETQARKDALDELCRDDFTILTFDSLLSAAKSEKSDTKNILQLTKNIYEFKYMHMLPELFFSWIPHEHFRLSEEQRNLLISSGYEIEKWEQGQALSVNGTTVDLNKLFEQRF